MSLHDIRFALRMLRRSPGFTAIAVLTMALGIGAVSGVFSLVNTVLLDGLPFDRADRVVFLRGIRTLQTPQPFPLGLMDIDALGAGDALETLSPVTGSRPFNLEAGAEIEHVTGEMVGADYFGVLRIGFQKGRPFSREEAAPGTAQAVVILSDGLWRNRFGADPAVLDRTIDLNDRAYRVVGVTAPGFRGLTEEAQVWLPIGMAGTIYGPHYTNVREFRWLSAVGRLRDGAELADVRQVASTVAARLASAFPRENDRLTFSVTSLADVFLGDLRSPLVALFGAAAFVLLIACVNVANMQLARGNARAIELAVRRALGAEPRRLAAQLVTETVVLCSAGAAGGLLLAYALPRFALALAPPELLGFVTVRFEPIVAAFVLLCTVLAAIVSGLVPSALLLRQGPAQLLREGSRSVSASRQRFQRVLVVAEVSLALALLIGASAMVRGFTRFVSTDLGLQSEAVLTLRLDFTADRFKQNDRYWTTAREVLARARAVPGVADAALEGPGLPTSGSYAASFRRMEAAASDPDIGGLRHHVSPGYFRTLGIAIRAGRDFGPEDAPGAARALVVSHEFADRVWPGRNPLGERLAGGSAPDAPVFTVVGVVDNVRHAGRTTSESWAPDVYLDIFQSPARSPATLTVLAKSRTRAETIATGLQAAAREGSGLPPYDVRPLEQRLTQQTSSGRFAVLVMSAFAIAALLLAAGGVYAVVSYIVSQRTREVGIRLALGSSPTSVVWMVLRLGLTPVAIGVAIGLTAAWWCGGYLSSLLYGLQATDPIHVAAMVVVMAVVAAAATLVPAVRALRVSPSIALRSE